MPRYTFRTSLTPQGFLDPVDLEHRVLASLQDASADGIEVHYDWSAVEVGRDERGDYVRLDIDWPPNTPAHSARKYIERLHVDVE